jgi:hypothetical protein
MAGSHLVAFAISPRNRQLRSFFIVWGGVERMNPWGVERLSGTFLDFGVPTAMCEEVDTRLYLDLRNARCTDTERIRVEGRHTGVVFWVQVDGIDGEAGAGWVTVSFQRTPLAADAFDLVISVEARPRAVVAALLGYHRAVLRMVKGWSRCRCLVGAGVKRVE